MDDRREDWRSGVDENLVTLNTAQRVTERQLDDLDLKYDDIDKLLRGDAELEHDGLIARLHSIETTLNKLAASVEGIKQIIEGDHTGHPGLKTELKDLKEGRLDRRQDRSDFWKFVTAIAVALITGGYLRSMWPKISTYLNKPTSDPVAQMIENAKKPKHRHYTIHEGDD